jgi:hypothetical protein
MLAKKIIEVYGRENDMSQIPNNGGIDISVKFLTIHEASFLRIVLRGMIEGNTHNHLMTQEEKLQLLNKLKTSVLYESKA